MNLLKIKKIIKRFLPYFVIVNILRLRKIAVLLLPYFVIEYQRKREKKNSIANIWQNRKDKTIPEQVSVQPTFKYVVSAQGFGHSGSGALIDMLREFPKATVIGGVDRNGSQSSREESLFEFDIIRLAGGLFEIEKLIESKNIFINDALIKRFIFFLDDFIKKCRGLNKDKFQNAAIIFLNHIIDFSLNDLKHNYFNSHLKYEVCNTNIYFLKRQTKEQYIHHCFEFLQSVFLIVGDNHLLVLDQLFSDIENDFIRNKKYVPNLKTIAVQRDPRDVFFTLTIKFIPRYDAEIFVKWYNTVLNGYPYVHPDALNLRFEDLIFNYDCEREKILDFLDLTPNDHAYPKTKFVPEISAKNVGLWKGRTEYKAQIACIETHLAKWCYER
jgi:hypothetical protein